MSNKNAQLNHAIGADDLRQLAQYSSLYHDSILRHPNCDPALAQWITSYGMQVPANPVDPSLFEEKSGKGMTVLISVLSVVLVLVVAAIVVGFFLKGGKATDTQASDTGSSTSKSAEETQKSGQDEQKKQATSQGDKKDTEAEKKKQEDANLPPQVKLVRDTKKVDASQYTVYTAYANKKTIAFKMPSNNIVCTLDPEDGNVRCEVITSPEPRPEDVQEKHSDGTPGGYNQGVFIIGANKVQYGSWRSGTTGIQNCYDELGKRLQYGDPEVCKVEWGAKNLEYGTAIKMGDVTCVSTDQGLTCLNSKNKGLFVAKHKYEVYR